MYIAICGIDGSGKSTALKAILTWLEENQPREIVRVREPGGTPYGEELRRDLLERKDLNLTDRQRMLLMTTSRDVLLTDVVVPALKEDKHVVSDRCWLSTKAYQCRTKDLDRLFQQLHVGYTMPDIIVLLDVSAEEADERISGRGEEKDSIEEQGVDFQAEARGRYLEEARTNPFIVKVSSAGTEEETYQAVLEKLTEASLSNAPLSFVISNGDIYYMGRDGQTGVPVEVVFERLVQLGYDIVQSIDGTWHVAHGGWGICTHIANGLLNRDQAIKIGLSDAIRQGHWNGLTDITK